MNYKTLAEIKYAFLSEFDTYLKNNNLTVEDKESAQNAMRDFLNERLNSEDPSINFEDSNPELALWAYSYPPFISLLPDTGVDYDKNVTSIIEENIERIRTQNPEFAEWIEKNPKLNGKLGDENAVNEWNEYVKNIFTLKKDAKPVDVPAVEPDLENAQTEPIDVPVSDVSNPEANDTETTLAVVNPEKAIVKAETPKRKVERSNKFKKIALVAGAAMLALAGFAAAHVLDNKTVEVPNATPIEASYQNDDITNIEVSYDDYKNCVSYITSIMDRVNSEDENYTLARTSLSDSAAQTMPLMGLMDSVNAGQSTLSEDLVTGINSDGFIVPENGANVVIENTALTVSYMLVNHPDEIKLSDMVLGSVDKDILDGLQDRYNAVINAEDEVSMKKALFELSEYEEKNCGTDGVTHIIGNEVVGTVIPQKVAMIQAEKGWDIISSVTTDESFTAEVTDEGVFAVPDESVNQIKMIDNEGNEIVDSGIGLVQEDIDALRISYEQSGKGACFYEGRGKFNSISSNPELNKNFKEFGEKAGFTTAFEKTV